MSVNTALVDDKLDDNANEKEKVIKVRETKCPEYILQNARKYYNKKKEDPEFVEKERARIKAYRDANRQHINELARIRWKKNKEIENTSSQ